VATATTAAATTVKASAHSATHPAMKASTTH